jgi:hypothetical protein
MEEEKKRQMGVSSYLRNKSIRKDTPNGYKSRSLNTREGIPILKGRAERYLDLFRLSGYPS